MCRDFKSPGVGTGCVVDADLLNKDESNTEGSGNSKLCQFILSGLKTPHNIQLLNFFGEFHTWVRFSLGEETV